MLVEVLKSKIYKAVVTHSSINYSGSFGIDKNIMDKVNLYQYEKILIVNMNTGERFETYCIIEPAGSGKFALYGGAARLGVVGDPVIVMAFSMIDSKDALSHKPIVLNF
ncbi:MAG: Aspartate 1-decarboxylase [uncultured bacterium]|nr:MAG: Aspartate 1-decarboxylase [uncultured bacterium]